MDGVEEEVEGVRVAQHELAGVEGREAELAASERPEAGEGHGNGAAPAGGEGARGRGGGGGVEEQGVEREEAADALLDLHDAVEGVVADALLLLREGGGLRGVAGVGPAHGRRRRRRRRARRAEGGDATEHRVLGEVLDGFGPVDRWERVVLGCIGLELSHGLILYRICLALGWFCCKSSGRISPRPHMGNCPAHSSHSGRMIPSKKQNKKLR